MINNGRLRNRIEILRKSTYKTEMETTKAGYKILKSIYAEVRPLRGNEYLESVALSDKVTYKITINYQDIVPSDYVRYKNNYFNIQSVIDVNNRHETIELMCVEHIGNNIEVVE